MTELELKLLVPPNTKAILEQNLLSQYTVLKRECADLSNHYFDTQDMALQQAGIGIRVRGKNHSYEQTLKTKGQVTGGLHKRDEFNISLADDKIDLSLFNQFSWPDNLTPAALQSQITAIFTTHFSRQTYLLEIADAKIELACDEGKISSNEKHEDISEIELELIEGPPDAIFILAEKIATLVPVKLGVDSKAARGYRLLSHATKTVTHKLSPLPISTDENLESSLLASLEYVLNYWQMHASAYQQNNKFKHLYEIYNSLQLLAQILKFYAPEVECPTLISLRQQVNERLVDWQDIIQMKQIKELLSNKGPYRKLIEKDKSFISFLKGRFEGLLQQFNSQQKITAPELSIIAINLIKVIFSKPWRLHTDKYNKPITKFSQHWLNAEWKALSELLPEKKPFSVKDYLNCESYLKQIMHSGILLANLYPMPIRSSFRSAWLDILQGVEELNTLSRLQIEVNLAQVKGEADLVELYQTNVTHLLKIMEISRKSALKMQPYWL